MRALRSSRRLFAALAVTALVVSACGGSDDASSDGATTDTSEAAAPGDVVDVNVWIAFTDDRLDWTQGVAAAFNEQLDGHRIVVSG